MPICILSSHQKKKKKKKKKGYFNNIYGDKEYPCSFIKSITNGNKIKLINSKIEDVAVKFNIPFFDLYETILEITNTSFRNCISHYGYLVYMKPSKIFNNEILFLNVTNSNFNNISSLIQGDYSKMVIEKSEFSNIITRLSIPVIVNSLYSTISISDTIFRNITSYRSSIFGDESNYTFSNVKFLDIISNSIAMISIMYNSISLDNCVFSRILCNGDSDASSLILYNSNNNRTFTFKNSIINDCISNGDLLRFNGDRTAEISFHNVSVYNNVIYGSLVDNRALNSIFNINNSTFSDNKNINKYKFGLISNYNNANVCITKSNFINNILKYNGGTLSFINNNSLNIKIKSCLFERNQALNGAAIYINSKSLDYENSLIELLDTKFIKNKSKYFGGSIYSNFSNFKNLKITNVEFNENYAYAGGAIYIVYSESNNTLIDSKSFDVKFINNTSESHGNNYATQPYIIKVNEEYIKNKLYSGELLPLDFELLDNFNQTVYDISRMYQNMNLRVFRYNQEEEEEDNIIILSNDMCYFSKGIFLL
ncbi:hypothetical protein BCR36DRAFT_281213 [Piromyces finnis]|uniref:Right handed beta helix domain-containing protein n=1 Tax=Piromyces finnis TaxID=1754191 RepID=A0A1Y1VGQ1_9FUNG|nr:hypothetical protein BCR36DRAFT_281213 [Piromyces finnis]|eukprot:ORX55896.1 hypothetical protein BCR36DRAFT_281213 [Piromyces finnis]